VRDGDEGDVVVPAAVGAALEVVELTDHSAMALELNIAGTEHLEVNPFLSSEQPALF
jgi:hypothetical protein